MRNRSPKTAAIYRKWTPVRHSFIDDHPFCMICGETYREQLAVHEMTPGANRMRGFVERAAWLVACGVCNCDRLTDKFWWPIEKQLAVKLWYDPDGFDLETIWRIHAVEGHANPPQFVTYQDVLWAFVELCREGRFAA